MCAPAVVSVVICLAVPAAQSRDMNYTLSLSDNGTTLLDCEYTLHSVGTSVTTSGPGLLATLLVVVIIIYHFCPPVPLKWFPN